VSDSLLDRVMAHEDASLLDVMATIDGSGSGMCCLVDAERRLVAVLTDGDVRRALLAGAAVSDPALQHASVRPYTVEQGTPRANVLDLMRALHVVAIPEVSADGRLLALHTLIDIVGTRLLPNAAVIMAGGKGTRLGELTRTTPKPLMPVAGRPIIEWIILGLVSDGVRKIFISVNHLADQIVERLGSGERLGCQIEYLHESADNPLGTAGSLTLLPPETTSDEAPPIIVLNADLMVQFDARALLAKHAEDGASMTLGTKSYQHTVPFGVVEVDEQQRVLGIAEKPTLTVEINAAVYCIDAALARLLPEGRPSTMPELAQLCLDTGRTVMAWPIDSDWIDIGTPHDLARAKGQR